MLLILTATAPRNLESLCEPIKPSTFTWSRCQMLDATTLRLKLLRTLKGLDEIQKVTAKK